MAALDPIGNIGLTLQVVILFLLILGLPFVRSKDSKKSATRHGYLTLIAVILHSILIFAIMVPSLTTNFGELATLSLLDLINVWSHAILGTVAEILGIILVAYWILKSPSKMACFRMKALMTPTFIIWAISLVNGTLIHILGML
jgi:hypothetical protein